MKSLTFDELLALEHARTVKFHHSAYYRGYVSVKHKNDGIILPYKGRFGEGYMRLLHNERSTTYAIKQYWVFCNKE